MAETDYFDDGCCDGDGWVQVDLLWRFDPTPGEVRRWASQLDEAEGERQ